MGGQGIAQEEVFVLAQRGQEGFAEAVTFELSPEEKQVL